MEENYLREIASKRSETSFMKSHKSRKEKSKIELRRQKRCNDHQNRRLQNYLPSHLESLSLENIHVSVLEYQPALCDASLSESSKIGLLKELLESNPPEHIAFYVLERLKFLLSVDLQITVDFIVSLGFLDTFLKYLGPCPEAIISESACCLSNIISFSHPHAMTIVEKEGIPKLMHPMENTLWALANLAGDCPEIREKMLKLNILQWISDQFLCLEADLSLSQVTAWLLSNLSRNSPYFSNGETVLIMTLLLKLILIKDEEVLKECLWGFSCFAKVENSYIQMIIDSGAAEYGMSSLTTTNLDVLSPAIRLVNYISSGTDKQCEYLLEKGLMDLFPILLNLQPVDLRKEVFWTISNITAGNSSQILRVIKDPSFPQVVRGILDTELSVRTEAVTVLSNAVKSSDRQYFVIYDLYQYFNVIAVALRNANDPSFVFSIVDLCYELICTSKDDEEFFQYTLNKFNESGCYSGIEELTMHSNKHLSKRCLDILQFYERIELGDRILEEPEVYNL